MPVNNISWVDFGMMTPEWLSLKQNGKNLCTGFCEGPNPVLICLCFFTGGESSSLDSRIFALYGTEEYQSWWHSSCWGLPLEWEIAEPLCSWPFDVIIQSPKWERIWWWLVISTFLANLLHHISRPLSFNHSGSCQNLNVWQFIQTVSWHRELIFASIVFICCWNVKSGKLRKRDLINQ